MRVAPRASRAGLAAAGAAGVLCVVVLAVWQVSPLELLQSADRNMAGQRMIAMGKELEREGAEVAGARLIKQANQLIGRYYGKIARNAHNLKKTALTRHPEDIGFSGHAPFTQGEHKTQFSSPASLNFSYTRADFVQVCRKLCFDFVLFCSCGGGLGGLGGEQTKWVNITMRRMSEVLMGCSWAPMEVETAGRAECPAEGTKDRRSQLSLHHLHYPLDMDMASQRL